MSSEETKPKKKAGWLKRVIRTGLVLLVLAAPYGAYRWYWIARVDARLAAIRAEGYPVTLEELNAWYEEPDGFNAADIYEQAFEVRVRDWDDAWDIVPIVTKTDLPAGDEPLSAEMKKAIEGYLVAHKKVLELLHQGAAIPKCRYSSDFRGGWNTQLAQLGRIRWGARMLVLEALLAAEAGQGGKAVTSAIAVLRLGRTAGDCPVVIAHLVGIACDQTVLKGLERVLSRERLAREGLLACREAVSKAEERGEEQLERVLVGERCFIMSTFTDSEMLDELLKGNAWAYAAVGVLDRDHVFALESVQIWFEALEEPLSRRESFVAAAWEETKGRLDGTLFIIGDRHPVSRLVSVGFSGVFAEGAKHVAWLRTAQVGLSIELFRLKHGKLPAKLDELVPDFVHAVPADPFDNKPLRYKKLPKGYVVYSVGWDKADDGGSKTIGARGPLDITFTVTR